MVVLVALLLLALHPALTLAQGTASSVDSRVWAETRNATPGILIPIDWSQKKRTGKVPERVTPKRQVSWRIARFNFMRFEPEVTVESKVVPGYELLEKLWSNVLSLAPLPGLPVGSASDEAVLGKRSPFLKSMEEWRAGVQSAEQSLSQRIKDLPKAVVLTIEDSAKIAGFATRVLEDKNDLETLRKTTESWILRQYAAGLIDASKEYVALKESIGPLTAEAEAATKSLKDAAAAVAAAPNETARTAARADSSKKAETHKAATQKLTEAKAELDRFGEATLTPSPIAEAYYAKALYDAQLVSHNALAVKHTEFLRRAQETAQGRTRNLESQKAGTIVTIKALVKPVGESAEDAKTARAEEPITVDYYIQSEMPVVFHAGVAWTNIKSFDYEIVQKSLTGDVFQRISKPDASVDLTTFMTYLFTPTSDGIQAGFGLTIGTGIKDPGKKLFVGTTFKFHDRLLLTGGGFSEKLTENDGAAIPSNANLFEAVKRVQKWGWFVSFGATPF